MTKRRRSHSILKWIFQFLTGRENTAARMSVVGDLLEESEEILRDRGPIRAGLWRLKQICLLLPACLADSLLWRGTISFNYTKTAWRNIKNHKAYSLINISGLSIGIGLFLLLSLFVHHEFQVGRFNIHYDRIYRIETPNGCVMPPGVGHLLRGRLPEAQDTVRFHLMRDEDILFRHETHMHTLKHIAFADESVFDVFTFPFIKGDPDTALNTEFSLVLTESTAERMFGDADPIGQAIQAENRWTFTVRGVIADVHNFHFPITAIGSFSSLGKMWGREALTRLDDGWQHPTYLLLPEDHDIADVEAKINGFFEKENVFENTPVFRLRPLSRIYLASESLLGDNYHRHGSLLFIRIFIVVAMFILLIASVNFINMSTAKASRRAREVGVKKVVGASRGQLMGQFLWESQITVLFSLGAGLILADLLLPYFSRAIGAELSLRVFLAPPFPLYGAAGVIVLGLLAGLYPAFYLSGFTSSRVLKNILTRGRGSATLRKALTVIQFALSTALIVSTLTVFRQLDHMKNAELGFRKEHILTLPLNRLIENSKDSFKQELMGSPHISHVTFSCTVPGESMWTWGNINDKKESLPVNAVDPDFFAAYGVEIIEGRNFSWDRPVDRRNAVVLNESAVKFFNFDSPLGQELKGLPNGDGRGSVIGVVRDFHFNSLHTRIKPTIFYWLDWPHDRISVKVTGLSSNRGTSDLNDTIGHIQGVWTDLSPEYPFDYRFLDESYDRQYRSEERLSHLFFGFALLAVFISCLGLFGLVSFSTEQRTKEIGVRKVLGATAAGITRLLAGQFIRWVLAANLIAWPLAFIFLRGWLRNFAYRTHVGIPIFLLAGALSLIIACMTVGFQAVKASVSDPIKALRYE